MLFRSGRSTIALDLGRAGVAVCQLARGRAGLRLRGWGRVEDALRDAISPEESLQRGADRAARLIAQSALAGRLASLALKPPDVAVLSLALPELVLAGPPQQRRTALRFEAARHAQCSPEDLEVDYWLLPPRNRSGHNVMAVAAPRTVLERWDGVYRQLGLELAQVEPAAAALLRAGDPGEFSAAAGVPPHERLWGVLDLGFSGSTLVLGLGSVVVLVRAVPVSGDALTRGVSAALTISYGDAERLKRQSRLAVRPALAGPVGRSADADRTGSEDEELNDAVTHVLRSGILQLCQETARSFSYVMENYPHVTPVGLFACGGGARQAGLTAALAAELGIEVALLNPLRGLATAPGVPPLDAEHAVGLAACLGLARGDLECD